ncbi:glycosyltransferase family 2 protein [Bradyrhizobium sp. 162]|uniref:glycosyltransferase family 2 protein n=1 Tax=Bradyrhizobium sp. 162 TaxID=2782635 RepID=UPI001FF72A6D|nr:glycosyltransferase family 2 protein [Bradyrhizobium sp. 162]MCK1635255.1 glycosyltransferase [Bradyrhizobium sp. 162]
MIERAMFRPLFSILLPSRNRLELLKHALASIQIQDFSDFEVIVSDNASDPPYADDLEAFASLNVRIVRSDTPLSVTRNWNVAIEAARGDYAIMLGDDDALTPGLLSRLSASIRKFDKPDVIYQMAYHYAYPGVFESEQNGYFCSVNDTGLFDLADEPYELEISLARKLGRQALNFHHEVSFNAQHFVWKLDYVRKIGFAPFFQSPYPDYFACFATFLTAAKIVVVPSPEIIIGIAKQSFGFYFANSRQAEGTQQFLGEQIDDEGLAGGDQRTLEALRHPGSVHTRSWLVAALFVKRALGSQNAVSVDVRRYSRIQAFELAQRAGYLRTLGSEEFWADFKELSPRGQAYTKALLRTFRTLGRVHGFHKPSISHGLFTLLNIYHTPKIHTIDIGPHDNIMDPVRWLARDPANDIVVAPPDSEVVVLSRQLQALNSELSQIHAEHGAALAERDAILSQIHAEHGAALAERDAILSQIHAEHGAALAERDAIVNSSYWRAISPIRNFILRLRRI